MASGSEQYSSVNRARANGNAPLSGAAARRQNTPRQTPNEAPF